MNKKNSMVEDIIMYENYMPTELDLFIILYHYNISSIVVSNKGFVLLLEAQNNNRRSQ